MFILTKQISHDDQLSGWPFQCLASDKTHYKPIDLPLPEQWVFGYTLCKINFNFFQSVINALFGHLLYHRAPSLYSDLKNEK